MANLTETASWEATVNEIATTDPVVGGAGGPANVQATQLANRTAYLKGQVDGLVAAETVAAHEAKADPHVQYLREADAPSQAEAEAGLVTTVRAWSALRVKQAIQALVKSATELVAGIAEIATQAETDAGVDDLRFITPKKLRFGFSVLAAQNGYIVFPTWMGGIIIQWGGVIGNGTFNFPIAFPTAVFTGVAVDNDAQPAVGNFGFVSNSSFRIVGDVNNWIAIGH